MAENEKNGWKEKIEEIFKSFKEKTLTEDNIKEVLNNPDEIFSKVKNTMTDLTEDVKLLYSMIQDWYKKEYTVIPVKSITMIVFTLIYVINPFDLIPDEIPVIGQLDDMAIISYCLKAIDSDIKKYKEWKENTIKCIESGE